LFIQIRKSKRPCDSGASRDQRLTKAGWSIKD
jgi:hypothetical protein